MLKHREYSLNAAMIRSPGKVCDLHLRYQTVNRANKFEMLNGRTCAIIGKKLIGEKCPRHYRRSLRR